jgi:ABC-type sulfate transport system substrate-binding protein
MAVRLPEAPYCLLYWSGPRRRAAKNFYRARSEKVLAKYGNQFLKLKANP